MKKVTLFTLAALALMFVLSHLPSAHALPPGIKPNPTPTPNPSAKPISG